MKHLLISLLSFIICIVPQAYAEVSVNIGMSNALSGPAKDLGTGVKTGVEVYFNKINNNGGVNGHKINLISLDDGYEPEHALTNTNMLIHDHKVDALFSYVGTPTSKAAVPPTIQDSVPYIAPFTGAEFLRNPVTSNVFNIRASYFDETEKIVEYITKDLGLKNIALLMQYDRYGKAGQAGVERALEKRNMQLSAIGAYRRNRSDVDRAADIIAAQKPEAIIMVGAYKPCAEFMRQIRNKGLDSIFFNISFVGTESLIETAGEYAEGSYISQVMPSPDSSELPIVKQYKEDMANAGYLKTSYTSLEGYINAVVLVEALKNIRGKVTRANIINQLERTNFNAGGLHIEFNPTKHQALDSVYLTQVKNGKTIEIK